MHPFSQANQDHGPTQLAADMHNTTMYTCLMSLDLFANSEPIKKRNPLLNQYTTNTSCLYSIYSYYHHLEQRAIDPLHGDITFEYFRIRPFGCRHVWGSEMYCGDWEKGANRIVAHQRKWLLERNYKFCKIQAHRHFHASLIGVVTCVGEQWYV